MPYNTRRKSLNLSTLGIQVPSTSRVHRPSVSKPNNDIGTAPQQSSPPSKRAKHSHSPSQSPPSPPPSSLPQSPPASAHPNGSTGVGFAAERPRSSGRHAYQHTPPPSPGATDEPGINLKAINDDIVSGVVEQLEKTGNRPHLIKELASVLSRTNDSVAGSANPAALLSSRLAAYMRRPSWSERSPCPVAKELIPVHPRKVFYYLTTKPRQPLPASATEPFSPASTAHSSRSGPKRIISPSISDASQDGDEHPSASTASSALAPSTHRKRAALSPSPEIDLSLDLDSTSAPIPPPDAELDFPTPATPAASTHLPFSLHPTKSQSREGSNSDDDLGLHRHKEKTPLERDETNFSAFARELELRGMSLDERAAATLPVLPGEPLPAPANSVAVQAGQISGAVAAKGDHDANSDPVLPHHFDEKERKDLPALFGNSHLPPPEHPSQHMLSSPLVRPIVDSPALLAVGAVPSRAIPSRIDTSKPRDIDGDVIMSAGSILGDAVFGLGWDISKPEHVDLEELDDLLVDC